MYVASISRLIETCGEVLRDERRVGVQRIDENTRVARPAQKACNL